AGPPAWRPGPRRRRSGSRQLEHPRQVLRLDGHHAQTVPALEEAHALQGGVLLHLGQRHRAGQGPHGPELDEVPPRLLRRRLRVVVLAVRVELGGVGVGLRRHLREPDDRRLGGGGVVVEDRVARAHLVAHVVAGLVVAHAVPGRLAVTQQVVERVAVGLVLDEPRPSHGWDDTSGHSHSMVPGGLLVTSYTTRLTSGTALTIRFATVAMKSWGSLAQSAVIPSSLVTARRATMWP